jgi:cytochrome subunit of sulfide dehydrogenase
VSLRDIPRRSSPVVAALIGSIVIVAASVAVAADPPAGAAACTGCHPSSARVASPVPRLAGQNRDAIVKAMQDFRSGQRFATVMDRIAKGFTDEEVQAIAAWYAGQK